MNRSIKSMLTLASVFAMAGLSACFYSDKKAVVKDDQPDVVVDRGHTHHDHYRREPEIRHERVIESERPVIQKERIIERHDH